jgi:hypothetical protein
LIDATIWELRLEVEYGEDLFGSVLEASGGGSIGVGSHSSRAKICGDLGCSVEFIILLICLS